MQHIALELWKLPQPKLLISVTGGAQDFDLSRNQLDRLMRVSKLYCCSSCTFLTMSSELLI